MRNMAELKDDSGATLKWEQVKAGQRYYELRKGNEKMASLTFPRALGTFAEAELAGARYTFKRTGFLHPKVTIRRTGLEEDIGLVRLTMGGNGTLEFTDGKRYGFHLLSFWNNRWGFFDEQGNLLMTILIHPSFVKHDGDVFLEDARMDKHTMLLMVIGWYMMAQMAEEGEMAAVTAAVTVSH
jgi:hypothetical protein